jgi:hypothetical protein
MREFMEWKHNKTLWSGFEKGLNQKLNRYANRIFEMMNTKQQVAK